MTPTPDILALPLLHWFMGVLFVCVCVLLILIILLQKGRGGGLSGAFGGAGGSSAFGSKTGDVFTYITIALAVLFLSLSVANNFVFRELQIGADQEASVQMVPTDADGDQESTSSSTSQPTN